MQSDNGKLFLSGLHVDTNEERLREYFSNYGEVVGPVIVKNQTTGRTRGFGFVVFSDPAVADMVIKEKHNIDGRMVVAKKYVLRDDQDIPRQIFVGGLALTVTESDLKEYFDQFGTITDAVVVYDHDTQMSRGFGFITYDSEQAVDRVFRERFHELNGKTVEVEPAVPKELAPRPNPNHGNIRGVSRQVIIDSMVSKFVEEMRKKRFTFQTWASTWIDPT